MSKARVELLFQIVIPMTKTAFLIISMIYLINNIPYIIIYHKAFVYLLGCFVIGSFCFPWPAGHHFQRCGLRLSLRHSPITIQRFVIGSFCFPWPAGHHFQRCCLRPITATLTDNNTTFCHSDDCKEEESILWFVFEILPFRQDDKCLRPITATLTDNNTTFSHWLVLLFVTRRASLSAMRPATYHCNTHR